MTIEEKSPIPQPPYPLHPTLKDRIHPEYVAFYNEHIIDKQQIQYQPMEVIRAASGVLIPGGGPVQPVGKTEDILFKRQESTGPDVSLRVFTPETTGTEGGAPEGGWPVYVYFHGGGWVLGNIDTENTVSTHVCKRARVVVVSVSYRLAPENPFPAAVHDSWETLLWLQTPEAIARLNINPSKLAVGGSSAGGNLAAVMTHRALFYNLSNSKTRISILKQILVVPVLDNTALPSNNWSWSEFEFAPALSASKMLWFRGHYLPDQKEWSNPEASPLLQKHDRWGELPPAVIIVGELDVLRAEGESYAKKLTEAGVKDVELHVMERQPHPFLAMDAALEAGRKAITLMVEGVKGAVYQ